MYSTASLVYPLRKKLRLHYLSKILYWNRKVREVLGHLEGSESNIAHSVKEEKLDPSMTLMLTLVDAIMFATIHLLNHQAEQQKEPVFPNVTQVIGLSCNCF